MAADGAGHAQVKDNVDVEGEEEGVVDVGGVGVVVLFYSPAELVELVAKSSDEGAVLRPMSYASDLDDLHKSR